MRNDQAHTWLPPIERIPITLVALAAIVGLVALAGCLQDSTRPSQTIPRTPEANFDAHLNPGTSSFVLTRVEGNQVGEAPVEVELIGSNLISDPATATISYCAKTQPRVTTT